MNPALPLRVEDEIGLVSPFCAFRRMTDRIRTAGSRSMALQWQVGWVRHSSACGNQNAVHPDGVYAGADTCSCRTEFRHDQTHHATP